MKLVREWIAKLQPRARIKSWVEQVRKLYVRHQSLHLGLGALLVVSTVLVLSTGFGQYMNRYLFFNPIAKFRASFGLMPSLDDRLSMILVEDRSLKNIGRHPTFADWQVIANQLFDQGIEKIFFLGITDLDGELGKLREKHPTGKIVAGAVNLPSAANPRSIDSKQLPDSLLAKSRDDTHDVLALSQRVIGPHEKLFPLIDHVGHLNINDDDTFDLAYRTHDASIILNLPLYILPDVHWRDGAIYSEDRRIPASPNNTLMYDFVEPVSAFKSSMPVGVFFDRQTGGVLPELAPMTIDKLAGKKYVVFVKEAYQGSRFIHSPFGKVPSFLAIMSVLNSSLNGNFLYKPFSDWFPVVASLPLLLFLLAHSNVRIGLGISLVFTMGQFLVCSYLVMFQGWVLPSAHILLVGIVGWVVRLTHYALRTLSDKLLLSKDLAMGKAVQELFMPKTFEGHVGRWSYRFVFKPHGAMSGDWLQVYESPPDAKERFVVVAIGDVIGKGPSAALNTAVIAGAWNYFTQRWDKGDFSITDFVNHMHSIIYSTFKSSQNTTLSLAFLTDKGVTLCSCGAPAWLRLDPGKAAGTVRTPPSDPLGIGEGLPKVKAIDLELEDGEVLMAHTDGVMESGRVRKKFLKGMEEFKSRQREAVFKEVLAQAQELGKDDVLPDDFTMLMIRRDSAAETPLSEASAAAETTPEQHVPEAA